MKSKEPLGNLANTYREAVKILDAQKAAGVPLLERLKGLESVLREAWPQTREWHYLCSVCGDVGLDMQRCSGDATCGRPRAHLKHDYGKPCWCPKGARFKDKPKPEPEDFAAAGKSKPMTRIGRR